MLSTVYCMLGNVQQHVTCTDFTFTIFHIMWFITPPFLNLINNDIIMIILSLLSFVVYNVCACKIYQTFVPLSAPQVKLLCCSWCPSL